MKEIRDKQLLTRKTQTMAKTAGDALDHQPTITMPSSISAFKYNDYQHHFAES